MNMKRLTAILLLVLCLLPACGGNAANADSYRYARANSRSAYFFSEKDLSSSLFAVPYTYCIEVVRDEGDWYYARYAEDSGIYRAVYGYCRKSDFDAVEGEPEVKYLYKAIDVTYTTDGGGSTLPVPGEIVVQAAYYGNYYAGANAYSYVWCQGSFGYIEGATDDYPLVNVQPADTPPTEERKEGMSAGLISAIVICSLAAVALLMLFFTTRKKPEA